MRITVEITDQPAYHQQWGDYDYDLLDAYLRDDVTDALVRAIKCVKHGSVSVTVAVSRDGMRTGTLNLELE